jgi:hypothetical protein
MGLLLYHVMQRDISSRSMVKGRYRKLTQGIHRCQIVQVHLSMKNMMMTLQAMLVNLHQVGMKRIAELI